MTDDDFKFHVTTSLMRIATALERLAPAVKVTPPQRKLDLSDLTVMSAAMRAKKEAEWEADDKRKPFETH